MRNEYTASGERAKKESPLSTRSKSTSLSTPGRNGKNAFSCSHHLAPLQGAGAVPVPLVRVPSRHFVQQVQVLCRARAEARQAQAKVRHTPKRAKKNGIHHHASSSLPHHKNTISRMKTSQYKYDIHQYFCFKKKHISFSFLSLHFCFLSFLLFIHFRFHHRPLSLLVRHHQNGRKNVSLS